MATIGSFTAGKDGYVGTIRTLTVNVKARIVANDQKKSEGAPDFRVYAGRAELGAAGRPRPIARSHGIISASSSTTRASPSPSGRPCSRRMAQRSWCGIGGRGRIFAILVLPRAEAL
ncbi:hypothetical protein JCM17846_32500 [Iodidimonas nitroreducens]|uniref:DUF736 domain-containing protein n=1 Tax=Iodidimonas nitroreducens TaxID=1236968 RepID=A0A5A7NBT3_9PROT|nr:hypothetical protein JCM17846_32500 [Iodidimonas nitroreducens]